MNYTRNLNLNINNDILIKYPYISSTKSTSIKLKHIVIDMNYNKLIENSKLIYPLYITHMYFTGQRPYLKKANKSYANFKLRKNMIIGTKTTTQLTNCNFNFILDNIKYNYLPTLKRQLNKSMNYNYLNNNKAQLSLGIHDLSILPNINIPYTNIGGLNIFITSNYKNNQYHNLNYNSLHKFYFSSLQLYY